MEYSKQVKELWTGMQTDEYTRLGKKTREIRVIYILRYIRNIEVVGQSARPIIQIPSSGRENNPTCVNSVRYVAGFFSK